MAALTIIGAADDSQDESRWRLSWQVSVAKKLLGRYNIDVLAYTTAIGQVKTDKKIQSSRNQKEPLLNYDQMPRFGLCRKNGSKPLSALKNQATVLVESSNA